MIKQNYKNQIDGLELLKQIENNRTFIGGDISYGEPEQNII